MSINEHNRMNHVHVVSSPESHRLAWVQMRVNRCADLKARTSYRQLMEHKHSMRWIKGSQIQMLNLLLNELMVDLIILKQEKIY